ncbi:MAG: hypothetical protein ACRELY_02860 [Polyangiaceae bacterium]
MPKALRAPTTSSASDKRPALARAEILDKAARARIEEELGAALKRRQATEPKVAGCARALAPLSAGLRGTLGDLAQVMIRRSSFKRETYSAAVRALADADDRRLPTMLRSAFATDEAGGHAAFSAACFSRDPSLAQPLAKIAASRQSHLAFGAETARVVRGESNGSHLTQLAPMIKESHRLALCAELFVPLARSAPVPKLVGPALAVLRGAERHLGRWLVLAEVAARAGDMDPVNEAVSKADGGPSSSRAAWALVRWALTEGTHDGVTPPEMRPTVELIARLSDRPSADRDTTFLFRMARAGSTAVRPMLEALAKSMPLSDETAIRAALYLARDHGREDLREALVLAATAPRRDELRGLAVAALWDVGHRDLARDLSADLMTSKHVANVAWAALVRAAASDRRPDTGRATGLRATNPDSARASQATMALVNETRFRWIQWGWVE